MAIGSAKKVKIINGQRNDRPLGKHVNIKEVLDDDNVIDGGVTAALEKPTVPEYNPPQPIDSDEKKILAKQEDEADMQALRDIIEDKPRKNKIKKSKKKTRRNNE